MLNYFFEYLKKWKDIRGKMDRHNYWAGLLIILLIIAVLLWFEARIPALKYISAIFATAMAVPYISATIRRLHDAGKKTQSIFLIFIPVLGWIYLFVQLIQSGGNDGGNDFVQCKHIEK